MNFECRLSQCIRLTRADGEPVDSWLVLGEVVAVHIDESLLENGVYQTAKASRFSVPAGRAPITLSMKICVST